MSSVLRAPSQIPARIKYLLVVSASGVSGEEVLDSSLNAFTVTEPLSGNIFTDSQLIAVDPLALTNGNLYRDLGKQIVIIGTNGEHLAYFRLARRQNNSVAEGIDLADLNAWIKVWAASGDGVAVARTG